MKQYALLGTYKNTDRNNIEVIATSDKPENLERIKRTINQVNTKLMGKDRDCSPKEVEAIMTIINDKLNEIDIVEDSTGYINEINVIGIFNLSDVDKQIIITCPKCEKKLYEGSKKEAKRQIIYCVDCALKN